MHEREQQSFNDGFLNITPNVLQMTASKKSYPHGMICFLVTIESAVSVERIVVYRRIIYTIKQCMIVNQPV